MSGCPICAAVGAVDCGKAYASVQQIGRGTFGFVYLCVEADGTSYVQKISSHVEANANTAARARSQRAREIELKCLRELAHPNVVRMLEPDHPRSLRLEYCESGDLFTFIQARQGQRFTETEIIDFLVQMLIAVHHVHSNNMLHRDIKSANFFLSKGLLKLGDFGCARPADLSITADATRSFVGTLTTLAPEMLCGGQTPTYSKRIDVYSLGATLYELMALQPPFPHVDESSSELVEVLTLIRNGSYLRPSQLGLEYSQDLFTICDSMMHTDQRRRPSVTQLLRLPILQASLAKYIESVEGGMKDVLVSQMHLVHNPPKVDYETACYRVRSSSDTLAEVQIRLIGSKLQVKDSGDADWRAVDLTTCAISQDDFDVNEGIFNGVSVTPKGRNAVVLGWVDGEEQRDELLFVLEDIKS